jgi:hypothetical protein
VSSGTGRGDLAIFFASHESSFKVPSDCYTMATNRVLGLIEERASHARSLIARGAMRLLPNLVGLDLRRQYWALLCRVSASLLLCFYGPIPRCPCSWYVIHLRDRIVHVLEEFMLEAGAIEGLLRLAVGGPPYPVGRFSRSVWGCGLVRLHGSTPSTCC